MTTHTRSAQIKIDADALRHNLQRVREYAPESKVMAVIKANAYGHGANVVADALSDADAFALATPQEAIALRQSGISLPMIVLQGFSNAEDLGSLSKFNIQPVIHNINQIDILEDYSGVKVDVWLKLDTGMHRLGLPIDLAKSSLERLQACKSVNKVHLMTHLANADEPAHVLNQQQLSLFENELKSFPPLEASIANSAAVIAFPESHLQWVRPGIMLYGSSPLKDKTAEELNLKAAMNFESTLISIQSLKKGDTIGYGSTWKCPENMRIGVVAAGYADGYPRHAKSGTPVWINNKLCSLVGRVSMDSICVDLQSVDAEIGDRVVLWGHELSADVVAEYAETIGYEILCHAGAGC